MIVDLRDYTLVPGKRSTQIARFESDHMDEQERLGATMLGSFADADNPDRFVWLRACPDLATRKGVLTAFYSEGEMWARTRDEVNSWFIDTDNVLLVEPVSELAAPAVGDSVVGMYTQLGPVRAPPAAAQVAAAVAAAGGRLLVTMATVDVDNNYPRHPIRTGEHGTIWFATFPGSRIATIPGIPHRRLAPTPRSRMR